MLEKGKSKGMLAFTIILLILAVQPLATSWGWESYWTNNPPTIDGTISAGEWDDGNFFQMYLENAYMNDTVLVNFYFMNDANYLYIQLFWVDYTGDQVDMVEILFDEQYDRNWTGPGLENGLYMSLNSTHSSWYDGYCVQSSVHVTPDVGGNHGAAAATRPSLTYKVELAIPLGSSDQEDLQPQAGAVIGVAIIVGDDINLPSPNSRLYGYPDGVFNGSANRFPLASNPIGTPLIFITMISAIILIALYRPLQRNKPYPAFS